MRLRGYTRLRCIPITACSAVGGYPQTSYFSSSIRN
jgi:hypothetical protein